MSFAGRGRTSSSAAPINAFEYGCSLEELRQLMEFRGLEAREKIDSDYEGIEGLCKRLHTDPQNGLPNITEELEKRRAVFGANEIPPHPPKSFFTLVWEALQVYFLLLFFGVINYILGRYFNNFVS